MRHPATVIAGLALFVALGGGTVAYASGLINGSQIKNHSIATKKLTKRAIKQLKGNRGPAGPAGPAGAPGPQGPGGTILRFDATATANPSPKVLGTVLGDTWSAKCKLTSGFADLEVFLQTSDGSFVYDYGQEAKDELGTYVYAGEETHPAGTFSSPTSLGDTEAAAAPSETDIQDQGVQTQPVPGDLVLHSMAFDASAPPAQGCHLTVQGIPEAITTVAGTPHAAGTSAPSHRPNLFAAP